MKKKILHIQLLPLLSGVQNVMLDILESLDSNEYDIYVACKPNGELVDEILRRNYNFIPLVHFQREFSYKDIFVFFDLIKIIRKYNFEIVHTHSSKPGFLGRLAAKFCKVPKIIHTHHGLPYHQFQSFTIQNIYKFLMKISSKWGHFDVFVNNSHRKLCIRETVTEAKKSLTILNGMEVETLNIRKLKNGYRIGGAFRFEPQKNIEQLITFCIRFCNDYPNSEFTFEFVGTGKLYNLAKEMVCLAGLEQRILLPGWAKKEDFLQRFDYFMLYSRWEGLPLSILEAMHFGLPILASNIPGNDELVFNSVNGFLIEVDDYNDFKNKILKIRDKREDFSNNSKKIALQRFSKIEFQNKYKELYAR